VFELKSTHIVYDGHKCCPLDWSARVVVGLGFRRYWEISLDGVYGNRMLLDLWVGSNDLGWDGFKSTSLSHYRIRSPSTSPWQHSTASMISDTSRADNDPVNINPLSAAATDIKHSVTRSRGVWDRASLSSAKISEPLILIAKTLILVWHEILLPSAGGASDRSFHSTRHIGMEELKRTGGR
jgi:hypothetical protein